MRGIATPIGPVVRCDGAQANTEDSVSDFLP